MLPLFFQLEPTMAVLITKAAELLSNGIQGLIVF